MMPDLVIDERRSIPEAELRESFARSGGPGGQAVNKQETKVELRWRPAQTEALSDADRTWLVKRLAGRLTGEGDLVVTSTRTRDQARNRDDARAKLAAIVRDALVRPKTRRATRPSRGARERRLQAKKRQGDKKRGRRAPGDDRG